MPGPCERQKHIMGYLKELEKNRRYRIVYDLSPEGGKRRQKTETLIGKTRREAQAILVKREESVRNGDLVCDGMTISTLFERFMAKRTRLSPTTLLRYRTLFKTYLDPAFGQKKVSQLRQIDLIEAYAKWTNEGRDGRQVSERTIRHAHDLLRAVLSWAVRLELARRNVAKLIDHEDLPKPMTPELKALTESELRRLLQEAKSPTKRAQKRGTLGSQPWFYPAVAFAAYTGARRGEVLALRWSDLNVEEKCVTIRRSLCKTDRGFQFKAPKNDKSRVLTLPDSILRVLEEHRVKQAEHKRLFADAYQGGDLVFALPDGGPVTPNSFGATFYELIKRAGVTRIRLQDLRHTHGSLLAKQGVAIEVVSKRLGHSSIAITAERYLHVYRDRDAEAAGAFERLVG